jgi:hypothetical protein
VLFALQHGAALSVLHVVDNPFKKGWNPPTIAYEEEYRKGLGKIQSELAGIISQEQEKGMAIRELVKEGRTPRASSAKWPARSCW